MLPPDTKLISVDDHLIEPPHVWQDRVPDRYKEAAPRVIRMDDSRQAWSYEGRLTPIQGGLAKTLPEFEHTPFNSVNFDEMRPGCYESKARVEDMDIDGVWGSLAFPSYARFAGHRFVEGEDKELSLLCVQAYNDFLFDEWCAAAPDRLYPMVITPMWDLEASIREVERTAARGAKAVAFSENPTKLGLPSLHTGHWDPLFAAVQAAGLPICIHIGSSTELITSSSDAPWAVTLALNGLNAMVTCADWIYADIFTRFPDLKLVLSEGGAGWIPYILERTDKQYAIHGVDTGSSRRPSDVFADNIYACIVTDDYAIANIERIGAHKILWESDYPHNDGMWPRSRTYLEKSMADIADDTARQIGELNARSVFDI